MMKWAIIIPVRKIILVSWSIVRYVRIIFEYDFIVDFEAVPNDIILEPLVFLRLQIDLR